MVSSSETDYKQIGQYNEGEKFIQCTVEAQRKKWPILGSEREKGFRKGFTEEVIPELDLLFIRMHRIKNILCIYVPLSCQT